MYRKSIFITGAASGIGRATALEFAKRGWFTGLYDIDETGLESLRQEIGESGSCSRKMDVTDSQDVNDAVDHFTHGTSGSMNVLFNNAGVLSAGYLEEISDIEQERMIDVNFKGIVNCIRSALPKLAITEGASIINMSSASSLYGTGHLAIYSATKAAVSSLTESLNLEFERYGIHVCDIRVPYVDTPLLETRVRAASLDHMGTTMVPEDVARLVWKAVHSKNVHVNGKGIGPALLMKKILPMGLQRSIVKKIMLPD